VKQPDDPGLDPDINPLDPPEPFDPDPMKRLRESTLIRVYLAFIILVIVASAIFWE
jgi:hypothetical protein